MTAQPDRIKGTPLAPEDRARMARLYEEVEGRRHEMALIVARTLSLGTKDMEVGSLSRRGWLNEDIKDLVLVVCTSAGCGCYDNASGECYPCPPDA